MHALKGPELGLGGRVMPPLQGLNLLNIANPGRRPGLRYAALIKAEMSNLQDL